MPVVGRPMRALALALALALTLTAGCFGSDGGGTTPTPSASPTVVTATPEPTPEPTPEVTPTPEPPTPTEPLPPLVVANQSFDFSREGDATGQSPRTRPTDSVPQGYRTLLVNITTQRLSAGPTQLPVSGSIAEPTIRVYDPLGVEVHTERDENVQRTLSFPAIPGVWNVVYEGAGTMSSTVVLTAVG